MVYLSPVLHSELHDFFAFKLHQWQPRVFSHSSKSKLKEEKEKTESSFIPWKLAFIFWTFRMNVEARSLEKEIQEPKNFILRNKKI